MLFIITYIFLGFCALIIQTVCIREIFVVASGNEFCLGIVFGCWFAGIAFGAWLMGIFVRRLRTPRITYIQLFMLLCLIFPIQIACIRMLRAIFGIPPGQFFPLRQMVLGTWVTITPVSLIIGALFPLACRSILSNDIDEDLHVPTPAPPRRGIPLLGGAGVGSHESSKSASSIGRVYLAEALGSIVGGLCFTFFLVTRYHAFDIAALLGSVGCLLMTLLAVQYRSSTQKIIVTTVTIILLIVFGYGFFTPLADTFERATKQLRWNSSQPQLELIDTADSRYGHLALGKQAEQYALFSNGEYAAIFPDAYGAAMTAHLYLSEHPNPRQLLLIGGGTEGLIDEMLKHPVEHLDYVELDPKLLDLLAAYLPPSTRKSLDDSRVSVLHTDGRFYIKQATRQYDMVILNLPDPTTAMLNRFYTVEFFQEVRQILKPDGVVITDLSSSVQLQEDTANYAGSLYKTLRTVFPYVFVTPGSTNVFFAALQPDIVSFDAQTLAERYQARQIDSGYFSAYHFDTLLWSSDIALLNNTLQNSLDTFQLNTDMQPISYFYNLLLWTRFSGTQPDRQIHSRLRTVLNVLYRLPYWAWLLPGMVLIFVRWGYLQLRQPAAPRILRFNSVWTIGTTGFSGMALELMLLLTFQQAYGYLYQKTGLITAVFMVGLALGGYGSHRFARHRSPVKQHRALLRNEIALALFAILLPFGLRSLTAVFSFRFLEGWFLLLVGIAGGLTGYEFPLVSTIYSHVQQNVGRTAGTLDSADHLGALCGSLAVGTILIPLIGIPFTSYLVGFLKLSSIFFLAIDTRLSKLNPTKTW